MFLTLHVNETHARGCLHSENGIAASFASSTPRIMASDDLGLFMKTFLRDRKIDPGQVTEAAVASVVPDHNFAISRCFRNHFGIEPFFLKAGSRTGVKLKYKNPGEIGPDRIACAVAACKLYPNRDVIVAFFDTAVKFILVNRHMEYAGDMIIPGVYSALDSLTRDLADSRKVEMEIPKTVIGRSIQESVLSGVYWVFAGALREIFTQIGLSMNLTGEDSTPIRIGTGRFSLFFEHLGLFDRLESDLVHLGLAETFSLNRRNA